jgi:hypothetical protein
VPHSTADDQPDNVVDLPASDADQPIADDEVAGQIEKFTGRLLQITDPVVRFHVAAGLRDKAPWIQAVSASQLIEAGDYKTAADRLGKSRVYLDRLMRNHDQPTPRKRRELEASPAHRYGCLLGVYSLLADRADRRAADEYGKLEVNAWARPQMLPAIARSAERWMRKLPPAEREVWRQRVQEARDDVPLDELPGYLDITEQSKVMLGQSSARVRMR